MLVGTSEGSAANTWDHMLKKKQVEMVSESTHVAKQSTSEKANKRAIAVTFKVSLASKTHYYWARFTRKLLYEKTSYALVCKVAGQMCIDA